MLTSKYKVRSGFRVKQADGELIGEAIEERGLTTPEEFLKYSTPSTRPTHHLFEWDKDKAAHEHRLSQARYYFRSIQIVYKKEEVKAFHSVPIDFLDLERGKEYEEHKFIIKKVSDLEFLSREIYATMLAGCKKIRDLGLTETDSAWRRIVNCVERNIPEAVKEAEE